jgi:hypothetical protein
MVVTSALATDPTGTLQLLVAFEFTCTVQAPQTPIPQPNFVPVKFQFAANDPQKRLVWLDVKFVDHTVHA